MCLNTQGEKEGEKEGEIESEIYDNCFIYDIESHDSEINNGNNNIKIIKSNPQNFENINGKSYENSQTTGIHLNVYTHMHIYMYIYVYTYELICVNIYRCMYIHTR
jgi:hypothetical protein